MHFAILKNEFDDNHEYWINSCNAYGVSYEIIDIVKSNWIEAATVSKFDAYLSCPSGRESLFKNMYDEKIFILDKVLRKFVYPNFDEISLHENKKFLSYWLKANQLPHPVTNIFYDINDAKGFINNCALPVVAKINIGASGKGVRVFRDRGSLIEYTDRAFTKGIKREWGPNLRMGGYKARIINILKNPDLIKKKVIIYKKVYNEIQKGFIILQQYIPHQFEWRVVKIGDSYFGHQKIKQGDKASGTKGINYIVPPPSLLDLVKNICDRYGFKSMAIDLFEDGEGGYLINEMQCIFGHVQSFICEKDGQPGRFVEKDQQWHFEPGMFNTNLSYDLRLGNVIKILGDRKADR